MSACAYQREKLEGMVAPINEQPVRSDMTFATTLIVIYKVMVSVLGRQFTAGHKYSDDIIKL